MTLTDLNSLRRQARPSRLDGAMGEVSGLNRRHSPVTDTPLPKKKRSPAFPMLRFSFTVTVAVYMCPSASRPTCHYAGLHFGWKQCGPCQLSTSYRMRLERGSGRGLGENFHDPIAW